MTNFSLRVASLTIILASTACAARAPQRPHVWELRGAVSSVQGNAFEVRHKSGQIVRLTVDEHTVYVRDHSPALMSSLGRGTRVRVDVESAAGIQRARHVRIFGGIQ